MTANKEPIFPITPNSVAVKITAADTTDKLTAFTAGANGGAVMTLQAVSFDAAPAVVELSYNDGSSSFQMGEIVIPAGAGSDGITSPVNLFDAEILSCLDADASYILTATQALEVSAKATLTGNIDIVGIAGDY